MLQFSLLCMLVVIFFWKSSFSTLLTGKTHRPTGQPSSSPSNLPTNRPTYTPTNTYKPTVSI